MSRSLLNLRHVPDDEADEIRALLGEAGVAFYETRPSAFGISAGAIWVSDEADVERARTLLARYQEERRTRARAELEQARREGRAPTLLDNLKAEPLHALLVLAGVLLMLGMVALPVILLLG
jgi:hypothetical protein